MFGVKRTNSIFGSMGAWLTCAVARVTMKNSNVIIFIISIYLLTMKWLILLGVCLLGVCAIDEGDWVNPSLLPISYQVNSFYAGYLKINSVLSLYYVYTPSQNNPSKDPLVVVLSPFPGCSSLHQWLYQSGQFIFTRNSDNFRHNQNNWNRQANVLYLEGPGGTGYSFGPERNMTDNSTVEQYFRAILRFYQKFPQLKDQRMYLAGDGYAGIIAPRLALNIIQHNRDPMTPAWLRMNISGLLLFNPCTLAEECASDFQFNHFTVRALRNNFFISPETYQDFLTHCTLRTSVCDQVEQRIASNFKISGADIHNLFKECLHQPGDYDCIDHIGIDTFLNVPTVKEDMHAEKTIKWNFCNANVSNNYKRDHDGSLFTYQTLLREEHNLRIWIVSGSQSARVPTHGTKRWVDEVKLNLRLPTTRLWEAWFYGKINAGQIQTIPGLTLVTIRAAGYYMFDDQPEISRYVYDSYLKGTTL